MDNFVPDGRKLNFTAKVGRKAKIVCPVVGWTLDEGSVEPIVLVDGATFKTRKDYVAELSAQGQSVKVAFEDVSMPVPEPSGAVLPTPEL